MNTIFLKTISVISAFFMGIGILTGIQSSPSLGASLQIPTPIAFFETSLATAITSSATSMTLTSATDKAGTTLASSTYAFVLDSGKAEEEMVVADCTGTTCTNMTRGLSPVSGTTTVSALQFAHRRGASVKITDGPQLLILSRILNGVQTIPNKLSYTSGTACTVGDGNYTICDKAYIDGVAVSGASNANETTKGIIELSTASEARLGTSLGSTGARLVVPGDMATSSNDVAQTHLLVSQATGFLKQNFLDLTEVFNFTNRIGVGTSSPYAPLSVLGQTVSSYFTATTTTASTFPYASSTAITVSGTASTTNLIVSGTCTNCATNGIEIKNSTVALSGGSPSIGSGTVNCSANKKIVGGGASTTASAAGGCYLWGYPSDADTWTYSINCGNGTAGYVGGYAICVNQ